MAIDLSNLDQCSEDARLASLDSDQGPPEPSSFDSLMNALNKADGSLPPAYHSAVYEPFLATLNNLTERGYERLLRQDPSRRRSAGMMLDIAQAILQNAEGYERMATDGYQELVSDLYDGFLSQEDRRGVNPPDEGELPPLVKWGNPLSGPYVWTVPNTKNFGLEAAIINMPPATARRGVMAWAALPHETIGHAFLHADRGLRSEMAAAVQSALAVELGNDHLMTDYWPSKIDETASDLMGHANAGPAAGFGLICYFRGLSAAWGGPGHLAVEGRGDAHHPIDYLRGLLAAEAVALLAFDGATEYADAMRQEVEKDESDIKIDGQALSGDDARKSAQIVAKAVLTTRFENLENHSILDIQNWGDQDQAIADQLEIALTTLNVKQALLDDDFFATHAMAAAVQASLKADADLASIFDRMVFVLKQMHGNNPTWGPLNIRHRGDVHRHHIGANPIPVFD